MKQQLAAGQATPRHECERCPRGARRRENPSALGDVDGDATARNVGFDNATAAWALAASVDVEGAVHYALRRGDHSEAQRLIGERLDEVPDCQIALELRALERRAFGDNAAAARFYDEAAAVRRAPRGTPRCSEALSAARRTTTSRARARLRGPLSRKTTRRSGASLGSSSTSAYDERERAVAALKRAAGPQRRASSSAAGEVGCLRRRDRPDRAPRRRVRRGFVRPVRGVI